MPKKTHHGRRKLLYVLGFATAISVSFLTYTQSSYIEEYIGIKFVSLFFIFSNLASVAAISFYPKLIRRIGSFFSARLSLFFYALSFLALAFAVGPISAMLALLLFVISSNLVWINFDIFLEQVSVDRNTGKIRAFFISCINLGWLIGPFISAQLLERGGYQLAMISALPLALLVLLTVSANRLGLDDKIRNIKKATAKSFTHLWQNKNLRGVFCASVILNIFYSAAVLYIPIYLHQNLGIAWSSLGIIFSIMLLPFVFFAVPVGFLADEHFGEKEMMFLGLFILFSSLFLFFYIKSSAPLLWGAILFFSRIGASMLESTRDSYFYKNVDAKDLSYINYFKLSNPLGYGLGAIISLISIYFLPLHYCFLIISFLLIPGFFYIYSIEDTK